MELLMEHLGKGFLNSLIISMPVVLVAAGIGLVVGILQAVTQVQEQTIAAAPKILGVFMVLMIMGGFFTNILSDYLRESINIAMNVVTKNDEYALAPGEYGPLDPHSYASVPGESINTIMKRPGKIPFSEKKLKFTTDKTKPGAAAAPNIVEAKKMYSGR